jgi:GntR family transcriptional repressor for pyruvate dehydrogenase complex
MANDPDRAPASFTPVAVGRASAAIADQIRAAILEGRVQSGERLAPERELAEQFGVSRVTVRDALRILEANGLVEIRVGAAGGAFARAPTSQDVGAGIGNMLMLSAVTPDEIAEARLVLELGTVTLAVERATDEDVTELRDLVERASDHYDRELAWDFHSRLAAAAHNPAIELLTASFRGPLSMHAVRAREPSEWSHEQSIREHEELLRALEKRDAARARAVMAKHLVRGTNIGSRVMNLLRVDQPAPARRAK